jgi:uncharacterized membrane protein YeiH
MFPFLDIGGVAVFAFSGALEAGRKRMDLFGVLVVALVTALGGGTLRDLLLSTLDASSPRPVFWMANPLYIYVALGGGLIGFWAASPQSTGRRLLLVADALGLAAASTIGSQKALEVGAHDAVVLIMAVMTGVAGGIVRDILCNEVPLVFRPTTHLYATAALLGGMMFLVARALGAHDNVASLAAVSAAFGLRLLALRLKWALPIKRERVANN